MSRTCEQLSRGKVTSPAAMVAMFFGLLLGLLASPAHGVRSEESDEVVLAPGKVSADVWPRPKVWAEGHARTIAKKLYKGHRPPTSYITYLLNASHGILRKKDRLVRLDLSTDNSHIHVIGDVHGQFSDVLYIFEIKGEPSATNAFLFNGDLVDRGEDSTEVVLTLLAWQLAFPNSVHINRGNHEYGGINSRDGFLLELHNKYTRREGGKLHREFNELFSYLPLAHVIADQVFVAHGGLPAEELLLDDINKIGKDPDEYHSKKEEGLVWSDPCDRNGVWESPRGAGWAFGPDVTEKFLAKNNLLLVIRSHQVQEEGIKVEHRNAEGDATLMTVFSAPNYYRERSGGNKAGIVTVAKHEGEIGFFTQTFRSHQAS